jgi:hypothetical protein
MGASTVLPLLAGCPRLWLPKDLVEFPVDSCPARTREVDEVVLAAANFDRTTAEGTLECALDTLRKVDSLAAFRPAVVASKICYLLADRSLDRRRAERLAAEGSRWGEFAVAHAGDRDAEAHYYSAVNLGIAVQHEVVLAMAHLGDLEHELKRALSLDPAVDDGGPVRVLGMLYLKAPAWPQGIGDQDKALELLRRASRDWPRHPLNHLFYAQALWEVDGEEKANEVKEQIDATIAALAHGPWSYARTQWLDQARQLASVARVTPSLPQAPGSDGGLNVVPANAPQ